MELIETPIFSSKIADILSEDEYRQMQLALVINPLAGPVIPGSGGLRKLRWRSCGKGKRGGARIIYYLYTEEERIYLLYLYKKSFQEDLTRRQLKALKEYVKDGVV